MFATILFLEIRKSNVRIGSIVLRREESTQDFSGTASSHGYHVVFRASKRITEHRKEPFLYRTVGFV